MHVRLLHEIQIGLQTNEEGLRHGSGYDLSLSMAQSKLEYIALQFVTNEAIIREHRSVGLTGHRLRFPPPNLTGHLSLSFLSRLFEVSAS
jgi:hypothetical protein